MLDSFGHHPQMPQIMRSGGLDTYNIQRGVSDPQHPAAFWWIGIDGSKIRVEWMPHTYALIGVVPNTFPVEQVVDHIVNLVQPYIYNNQFAALSGVDLADPVQHLPVLARQYNQSQNDVELVIATMEEIFCRPTSRIYRALRRNPISLLSAATPRASSSNRKIGSENALTSAESLWRSTTQTQVRPSRI